MSKNNILFFWEDDRDIKRMFSTLLREQGYLVTIVSSLDECIKVCMHHSPLLLIIQRSINEMGIINVLGDGLHLVRELRAHVNIPYLPIVVGCVDFPIINRPPKQYDVFDAGANACFGAVFDVPVLLRQINALLKNPTLTGLENM